jgi:AcrR family transcriptional regulator
VARPRTFDEDQVVAAARDQFWNRGYAATSVDDLVGVTGLGKSSLYGAFGDKHSLFIRALDDYCTEAVGHFVDQLSDDGVPAYDRLVAHVRGAGIAAAADNTRRGCMMAKRSADLGAVDADVDRLVNGSLERWHAALAHVIALAQRDGAVRADADVDALATTLLGLMRGMEALTKGGLDADRICAATEQMLSLLVDHPGSVSPPIGARTSPL